MSSRRTISTDLIRQPILVYMTRIADRRHKTMFKTAAALLMMGTLCVTPAVAQSRSGMDAGTPTSPNTVNSPPGPSTTADPKATTDTRDGQSTRHRTTVSRKGCPSGQSRESANAACTPISQSQMGDVRSAQEALKAQGFDPGDIDGRYGPNTRAAVANY